MKESRLLRNIRQGTENLWLHKLRSFLTMLGVVFGVGSVVSMLSVGEGASKSAMDEIQKLGSSNIIINSQKSVEEESQSEVHSHMSIYGLTYDDHDYIADTFESIDKIAPAKLIRRECRLFEKSLDMRIVGTTPEWFELVPRPILAGRTLKAEDVDGEYPVAILTEFGARKLLASESTIGQKIRIGTNFFQIIGIVKSESGQAGNIQIPDQEIDIYIPLVVARKYFGDIFSKRSAGSRIREKVELHQIIAQVSDPDLVESTAAGLERMLASFHPKGDYKVSVPLALLKQARATKRTFNIVLGSIAGISLLVGGIGIMNIMLASVTERTREIGIRRAIGAKRNQIVFQFLIETIVLSTIGGAIGIGIGLLIPWIITITTDMPTIITPFSITLPLFISISIGILFGLYPAMHAAKVDPIIALRHE